MGWFGVQIVSGEAFASNSAQSCNPRAEPVFRPMPTVLFAHPLGSQDFFLRSRADEGQRDGTERELEESAPQWVKDSSSAAWERRRDDVDLPIGQSEVSVELPRRRDSSPRDSEEEASSDMTRESRRD